MLCIFGTSRVYFNKVTITLRDFIFVLFFLIKIIMKTVLVLSLMLAACAAAPQQNPYAGITITKQEENNNIGVDGYHYSYEQSDGHKKEETAVLMNAGTDDEALEITGSYQYQTADGKTFRVDYKADKDGFHPTITLL